jgi:hypothetical protein
MDGTLDTIELTKDCIGAETDPLPIASGDYCIETVTADGLRALVRYETGRQLYVAQGDATLAAGVYSVSGKKMLIDGTTPGSAETFTAAKRYVPTIGAVLNAPIRSGEIFTLLAIDGSGASVAAPLDFGVMPQPFELFATSSTKLKAVNVILQATNLYNTGTTGSPVSSTNYGTVEITTSANQDCDVWIAVCDFSGAVAGAFILTAIGTDPTHSEITTAGGTNAIRIATVDWTSGVALVKQWHTGILDIAMPQTKGGASATAYYMISALETRNYLAPFKLVDKTFVTSVDFGAETVATETVKVLEFYT